MIKQKSVQELNKMLESGDTCQMIDVREYSEFEVEKIQQAKLVPLSDFDKQIEELDRLHPVYLMCRSGNRAKQAAEKLLKKGFSDVHVIEGGMSAWKDLNLPVIKGVSKVWSLERQVRFAAGSLIVLGVILAVIIHPFFITLPAFVGAGLVFAAITDTCGMAMALAKMPWNKANGTVYETKTQKA